MPVNENCHLFERIIGYVGEHSKIIFNIEGKYGWIDEGLLSFDDSSLRNYFGIETLEGFVPENTYHELKLENEGIVKIGKEKIKDIIPKIVEYSQIKFGNHLESLIISREENLNKTYPKIISLVSKLTSKNIILNRKYFRYVQNNAKQDPTSKCYLMNIEERPVVCFISLDKQCIYGIIARRNFSY